MNQAVALYVVPDLVLDIIILRVTVFWTPSLYTVTDNPKKTETYTDTNT